MQPEVIEKEEEAEEKNEESEAPPTIELPVVVLMDNSLVGTWRPVVVAVLLFLCAVN